VAFGRRLRDARERNGVTLDTVAASTKIKASLLIGLEGGDVSLWPHGIFRRAFIREYAAAIGLPPASVLAEFSRFFPEEGEPASETSDTTERDVDSTLRLTLAADERRVDRATLLRVLAAIIDVAAILAVAGVVNFVAGRGFWLTAGVVGLTYQSVMTVWFGRSLAALAFQATRRVRARRTRKIDPPRPARPDRFHIVSRRSDSVRRAAAEPELDAVKHAPAIAARRR
jgi:cytoskeletal protein RodZ